LANRDELMDWAALDDEELATAMQQGHAAALDEVVLRHQGRVYAAAYRVMGNREDALDVAQDAFLKAYRRVHTWKPTGGFVPWLLRLTVNQAIDHFRKKRRRGQQRLIEDAASGQGYGLSPNSGTGDTERQVRAREIGDRVREALVVLSPNQRVVFELRHYEGLALAEIAEELGCTAGSVKVHLFRALKKLQKELGDLHEG
jgi:RNA polymerase sigma-70 factor, ECF subfamily